MLSFNNNHIFTGYLKQLLATFNIPTCKIYTSELERYAIQHGHEDPRVVESFGTLGSGRAFSNVNYLKNNEICNLVYDTKTNTAKWKTSCSFYYDKDKSTNGMTRTLKNLGTFYNTETHEYLGDFLRFLRDFYDVNLMPLYNCFNNKIYSNINFKVQLDIPQINTATKNKPNEKTDSEEYSSEKSEKELTATKTLIFSSSNQNYRIYAFPVKLFSNYTIAIDCNQGIELFCGLYKNCLDTSKRAVDLFKKTYEKVDKTLFNQPFLYNKLNHENWSLERELVHIRQSNGKKDILTLEDENTISRCDILNREQDLKLFIKIPASCRSSITVLEGDYTTYNNFKYAPHKEQSIINYNTLEVTKWEYKSNSNIINFEDKSTLNSPNFKPISKLQLLAFNTGESYPFSDRLIEYLSGSAITPIDGIADNIKRAQKVMKANGYYFTIEGIWENKMQKIAYDYLINSGPIEYGQVKTNFIGTTSTQIREGSNKQEVKIGETSIIASFGDVVEYQDKKYIWRDKRTGWECLDEKLSAAKMLLDRRRGTHPKIGHTSKSSLYDVLGYIDKDVEKYYANWKAVDSKAQIIDSIQNVDIYNKLYDI